MKQSQQLLCPKRRAISTPLSLAPTVYGRASENIFTGGCRTLVASDKASFQIADASQTGLDPGTSDFSICGWVYFTSVSGIEHVIDKRNINSGYGIYRTDTSLNAYITVTSGSPVTCTMTIGTVATNQWYFWAITFDRDGNGVGYLNAVAGTPVNISATSQSLDTERPFSVGCRIVSGVEDRYVGGSIASLAFATRVWTPAEITFLFNNKNALTYAEIGIAGTAGSNLLTNLISYWNCNEQDPTAGLVDQHSTNDLTRTAAELLTNGNCETRTGVTGASFAAGDKAHLEAADAAAFDLGTGDFVINANVLLTVKDVAQYIYIKRQDADNYVGLSIGSGNLVVLVAKVSGTTVLNFVSSTSALTTNTKYHIQAVVDRSDVNNCKIYVNGTSQSFSTATLLDSTTSLDNTGSVYIGQTGAGASYVSGRIAQLGIGKPADVTAAAVATAITNVAGSSGLGQYYNEQSSADKTALAWSVFYDLTEASGTRRNFVNPGTNDLAESFGEIVSNGAFTEADGTSPPTGWTNHATYPWDTADVQSNAARLICNGDGTPTSVSLYQQLALTSGRNYLISYVATRTSGSLYVDYNNQAGGAAINTSEGYVAAHGSTATVTNAAIAATASNGYLCFANVNNAAASWTLDNVSVKAASIPCSSDADVLGSWSEAISGSSKWHIETVAPLAGNLSARMAVDASNSDIYMGQAILTAGNSYDMSVVAAVDSISGSPKFALQGGATSSVITLTQTGAKTYTATLTSQSTSMYIGRNITTGRTLYFDTVSCKSAAIAVGNGPSEALATDSSGNGYHGTFVGVSASGLITNWTSNVPTPLQSQGGYAFTFDGSDDYVSTGKVPPAAGTISVWMKGNPAVSQYAAGAMDGSNGRCYVGYYGSKVVGGIGDHTCTTITGTTNAGTGWNLVTLTWSASDGVKLYLNASLEYSGSMSGTVTTTKALFIGALNVNGTASTFSGSILDDVRLYSSVLSAAQIAQLYAGSEATGATPVGWWKFDDGPFGIPSEGDPVWMWESLEANRYQFAQATAGNRPVHRLTGINNLPAEEGDGTSDILRVASVPSPTTFAVICQPDDVILGTPAIQALLAIQDEASANNFLLLGISADGKATFQGNNAGTGFTVTGNTVLSDAGKYTLTARWNGSNWHLEVNGVAQTETRTGTEVGSISGADSTTLFARYSNATASNWFDGKIAEYFLGNSSVYQLGQLTRYWKREYAI